MFTQFKKGSRTDLLSLFLLICTGMLTMAPASAEFAYSPSSRKAGGDGGQLAVITIHGRIRPGDSAQLAALLKAAQASSAAVGWGSAGTAYTAINLNSVGGSVSEAIEMGKIIRAANPLIVAVPARAQCLSACVFLLAGGNSRQVAGKVGIHRPVYEDDKAITPAMQKQAYGSVQKAIESYLAEVNIPVALYEEMLRVPAERVRILSPRELERFGLNEDDPYYKEAQDAWAARALGLSKADYVRARERCYTLGGLEAINSCMAEILGRERHPPRTERP